MAIAPKVEVPQKDPSIQKSYSMPESVHRRIIEEAARQDIPASQLVRKAVNHYLRWLRVRREIGDEDVA